MADSQGKLTPSFNENVTNYKVEVAADVNKIKIDAKAKDLKAQVNGIGEKSLEAGDNVFHIDVTAENGAVKTYTITVAVDEKPLIYVKYDNQQLGVVRNLKGVSIPANFHETTIKIEGKKVKAWENGILKKKIVYLSNEENEKNFYVFDEKKGITSIFVPMAILGNNVYYLGIPKNLQKRVGMQYEEVNVDQQKMMGWTFKDKSFANYTLIYVMDQKGTMKYYLHEKEENTLQLYSNAAATTQKHYEKLVSDYEKTEKTKILFMILSGIFAVTTLFGVWTILHNKRKN